MFASNTSQVSGDAVFVEDVFQNWLYTGNGSTQTITNGIDLAGKGGMVWFKGRNQISNHRLVDTVRGNTKYLASNRSNAQLTLNDAVTSFNSSGFSLGPDASDGEINGSGLYQMSSWTFRKQPKFFDVVTFTGNGSGSQFVTHNLQSSYGFIVIKRTDSTSDWFVLAKESSDNSYWALKLNSTAAYTGLYAADPNTSTGFYPSSVIGAAAVNGATYVAYLFAHNAGGFGLTGTDNVISCGSYTGNGSANGPTVTLNYEPQWLLIKEASNTGAWFLADTMRGFSQTSDQFLQPNSSGAEFTKTNYVKPLATGFQIVNADFDVNESGGTYIYIAIRRGPMKTPTSGTSVFSPFWQGGGSITNPITTGFPVDMTIATQTNAYSKWFFDRLRSNSTTAYATVTSTSTAAEITGSGAGISFQSNTGIVDQWIQDSRGVYWNFRRAPGFFDEVCYTGTSVAHTESHNLGAAPEFIIVKDRADVANWAVYHSALSAQGYALLNSDLAAITSGNTTVWNGTAPTSSVFSVGTAGLTNDASETYVAYLFASCPGVSKVGSYTGNGSTQTINCGFTGGARFVLIKRTDSTGDWYVYDTARGMTTLTDPYLLLNSTAAESATLGSVTTVSTGFAVDASILAAINTNSASYIFLAIA